MHFELEWDPLLYYVTIGGARFNWKDIISDNMEDAILRAQEGFFGHLSSSHMYSYLLDAICALGNFFGMGLHWVFEETPIHVCCQVLWDYKYTNNYK